ncbi:hypothetical protein C8Q74DRAFT_27528 [Fomes fomentarius]|nr:hypothetical protein C8Q74DRAFT_27528 [Fomes fomentarius]
MAGQIARALHHPSNEGLHSATFDTLIRECLLPRLAGKDIRGNPFAIGHYSQLAILKLSETAPLSKAHQVRLQAIDPDVDTARRIKAFQERRLPDFSSLIFFKEKKIVAKGRLCRVKTYLGPQFSITEVKSLEETAVNDLDRVLPVVLWGLINRIKKQRSSCLLRTILWTRSRVSLGLGLAGRTPSIIVLGLWTLMVSHGQESRPRSSRTRIGTFWSSGGRGTGLRSRSARGTGPQSRNASATLT